MGPVLNPSMDRTRNSQGLIRLGQIEFKSTANCDNTSPKFVKAQICQKI
jgi:hypothetical protein